MYNKQLEIRKSIRGIGWIAFSYIATGLSGLFLIPVLTKGLGEEAYGIWSQVFVTIGLVSIFAGLGLGDSITRFIPAEKNKKRIQELFYSTTLLQISACLVVSFLVNLFADFIGELLFDGATGIVRITSLIIPVTIIEQNYVGLFRALRDMRTFSLMNIFRILLRVGLAYYMVFLGYGIFWVVTSLLINEIILFIISFILVVRKIGITLPHFTEIKPLIAYGLPLAVAASTAWIVNASDKYIISYFIGIKWVGIYTAAYGLGILIQQLVLPIIKVYVPTLSQFYDEGNTDDVKHYLWYGIKYFLTLAIPFFFGLLVLSRGILTIISTHEIAANAYLVTPLVGLGAILWGSAHFVYMPIQLKKKTHIIGVAWGTAAIVNFSLNIVVVPYLGIIGAALTTLIAYMIILLVGIYYSTRFFKFHINWVFIGKSIFAAVLMGLVIYWINPIQTVFIILSIIAGAVIYFFVLFALKGFTKREIDFFKDLLYRTH